jgi:uncharacterized small protein (DUF1192 family)
MTLRERLGARRAELADEASDLDTVEELQARIVSLGADVARFEQQRDALAAWGDRRIEVPQPPAPLPGHPHVRLELEPLRSAKTGRALAAELQAVQIDPLLAQIREDEQAIRRLLRRKR